MTCERLLSVDVRGRDLSERAGSERLKMVKRVDDANRLRFKSNAPKPAEWPRAFAPPALLLILLIVPSTALGFNLNHQLTSTSANNYPPATISSQQQFAPATDGLARVNQAKSTLQVGGQIQPASGGQPRFQVAEHRTSTVQFQAPTILRNLLNNTFDAIVNHQHQQSALAAQQQQPPLLGQPVPPSGLLAAARDLILSRQQQQQLPPGSGGQYTSLLQNQPQPAANNLRLLPSLVSNRLHSFLFPQYPNQQVQSAAPAEAGANLNSQTPWPALAGNQLRTISRQLEPTTPANLNQDTLSASASHEQPSGRTSLISLSAPYEHRARRTALRGRATRPRGGPGGLNSTDIEASPHFMSSSDQLATATSEEQLEEDEEPRASLEIDGRDLNQRHRTRPKYNSLRPEFHWNASSQLDDSESDENGENDLHQKSHEHSGELAEQTTVAQDAEGSPADDLSQQTEDDAKTFVYSKDERREQQRQQNSGLFANEPSGVRYVGVEPGRNKEPNEQHGDEQQQQQQQAEDQLASTNEAAAQQFNATRLSQSIAAEAENNSALEAAGGQTEGANYLSDEQAGPQLTVQLPSQYETSLIRAPPEGHYDDYFKPLSNSSASAALMGQENLQDFSLAFLDHNKQDPMAEQQFNASEANSSSANTSEDYTMQYYSSQRPVKQVEAVEPGPELHMNNNLPGEYRPVHKLEHVDELRSDNSSPPADGYSTTSGEFHNQTDVTNNIHFIVANSSQRDPNSNEKMITYTSEGRNFTQPASHQSARNTFVNKDLNELPPGEQLNSDGRPAANQQPSGGKLPSPVKNQQSSRQIGLDASLQANASTSIGEENVELAGERAARLHETETSELGLANEFQFSRVGGATSRRLESLGGSRHPSKPTMNRELAPMRQQPADRGDNKNRTVIARKQRDFRAPADQQHRHRSRVNRMPGGSGNQLGAKQAHASRRRPQVHEAHFNPSELPMTRPTPMPSMTQSTVRSVVELPQTVKKLRQNPPDKNELMNELLTALDRVKTAIYKLQPLTAKMNAIYRKSVTSNTRNIIMDNHKGTYSKRYPPGDFDDSYDKMHPTDIELQQRASARLAVESGLPAGGEQRTEGDALDTSGSRSRAFYLPAPREFVKGATRDGLDGFTDGGQPIVATGVGRRVGNGQVRGQLSLSSTDGERIVYKDGDDLGLNYDDLRFYVNREHRQDVRQRRNVGNETVIELASASNKSENISHQLSDEDIQSPLFGYKITIFQTPADGQDEEENLDEQSTKLSYKLQNPNRAEEGDHDDDLMATSESSSAPTGTLADDGEDGDEQLAADESAKKSKSAKKESESGQKKGKKTMKGEKMSQQSSSGKKGFEEHKKKKEFKKIKHNKGVMSKESHKLHRDKHIKAHDRGAAKEKALKERTQIEFFEREQIVDDEYETAKKSTKKAGWTSGHDAKKTTKEVLGGDSMSMGGSHLVKHIDLAPLAATSRVDEPVDQQAAASSTNAYEEKGHGQSVVTSSGKQSNKFIKKNMEAKGKKFKGWREKGYKIITETEFIDRGSLHDSAYKKRDKGAAHHQKFKKHEASSEGHQGAMSELHKKSHKKEEKKKETKEREQQEKIKKAKFETEKKKNMKAKKEKEKDHEQEESAPTMSSLDLSGIQPSARNRSVQTSPRPLMTIATMASAPRDLTLVRLLNVDHDEMERRPLQVGLLSVANERRDQPPRSSQHPMAKPVHGHLPMPEYHVEPNEDQISKRSDSSTQHHDSNSTGLQSKEQTTLSAKQHQLTNVTKLSPPASVSLDSRRDHRLGHVNNQLGQLVSHLPSAGNFTNDSAIGLRIPPQFESKNATSKESSVKSQPGQLLDGNQLNQAAQRHSELKLLQNLIRLASSKSDQQQTASQTPNRQTLEDFIKTNSAESNTQVSNNQRFGSMLMHNHNLHLLDPEVSAPHPRQSKLHDDQHEVAIQGGQVDLHARLTPEAAYASDRRQLFDLAQLLSATGQQQQQQQRAQLLFPFHREQDQQQQQQQQQQLASIITSPPSALDYPFVEAPRPGNLFAFDLNNQLVDDSGVASSQLFGMDHVVPLQHPLGQPTFAS